MLIRRQINSRAPCTIVSLGDIYVLGHLPEERQINSRTQSLVVIFWENVCRSTVSLSLVLIPVFHVPSHGVLTPTKLPLTKKPWILYSTVQYSEVYWKLHENWELTESKSETVGFGAIWKSGIWLILRTKKLRTESLNKNKLLKCRLLLSGNHPQLVCAHLWPHCQVRGWQELLGARLLPGDLQRGGQFPGIEIIVK
jgi:hypothetical protein